VLIVGGGDGGLLRAVLDHPTVERAVQVEIDRLVVEASQAYLSDISAGAFEDPRAEVVYEDAFTYLERTEERFDVVLLDTTDPVGPAQRLFTAEFYGRVLAALRDGGIASAQSGSPWFQPDVVARTVEAMRAVFPVVRAYIGHVPTYPGGLWTFTLGSQGRDPLRVDASELQERFELLRTETRYFTPEIYRAAFALPPFVASLLSGKRREST
jgi:spermidine synthase